MSDFEGNGLEIVVGADGVGLRMDKYLGKVCDGLSRSRLQGVIAEGGVLLNGVPAHTASKKLELNDIIVVDVPPPVPCEPLAENIPLDVIFEDENLLVVNKPAGVVVHPGAGNWTGTMVNALLYHCGDSLSGIGGVVRPGIVHRLDKDTSGLMMVAKNDYAHHFLADQLADRSLSRVYHALVIGVPLPVKGVVDRAIGRHRHDRMKMSVMSSAPREARTHYRVLKDFGGACSLVECRLDTGRTHQIRVHMEALGHPLVGDQLYGVPISKLKSSLNRSGYSSEIIEKICLLNRQFLHACEIAFTHPETEEEMSFTVDLPSDLQEILTLLSRK